MPVNPAEPQHGSFLSGVLPLARRKGMGVIGCDDLRQLEENVRFARNFEPMTAAEQQQLVRDVSPFARQLMYYKP